ncbi:MAG: tRNA (N(6)-L-threonylcarbamoyladenosine(37)-C(2))-methylthiotransferase MtaB [Oligosphaeraceae bacterium]|nr:tRNA (N(6)-L-threonylcarbamoyladenosine(37)-C(2))-methylthiotransferase MtaB [Oligosphaeraceae bacterium]
MPTYSIFTLGCRLNQADSALLADNLEKHGFSALPWGQPADLLLINSCTVTAVASGKSRQLLQSARRFAPQAYIVLLGCDATAEMEYWRQCPELDLLLPNPKPQDLHGLLPLGLHRENKPVLVQSHALTEGFTVSGCGKHGDRTRATLKIQEGCDFHCSYCIVPQTRGPSRSRQKDDILREAEALLERGYKEMVLSGVNIACYQNNGADLPDLITRLLQLGKGFRLRLGSTEPGPCLRKLVDLMAAERQICRFLHLPLQYGEDSILRRMGRRYDCQAYENSVLYALEKIPGICLGTDLILGFPGETEDIFTACCDYVRRIPFALMHVFPYSMRQGTAAANMKERPATHRVKARAAAMRKIAAQKAAEFAQSQLGKELQVLLEKSSPKAQGWSDNYLQIQVKSPEKLTVNSFVQVKACEYLGARRLTAQALEIP